jgi:hypothetical protein
MKHPITSDKQAQNLQDAQRGALSARALYEAHMNAGRATPGAKGPATITKPAPGGAMSITQF